MHLKVIVIGLIVIAFSCSKTNNKTLHNANLSGSTAIVDARSVNNNTLDSTATATDTDISFGTELIEQKKACYSAFTSIKTSSDFLKAYHLLNQLEIDMNAVYDKMNSSLEYEEFMATISKMMGNALPWISADLVAEGTIPVSVISNKELQKSALLSLQTDDDAFVDLLLAIYGESGSSNNGIPVWTVMNCDVCYASVLGNGTTLKVLQKVDSIKAVSSQFAADAQSNVEDFFTGKSDIFESPKDEIVDEINKILETITLTDSQKEFLAAYRMAVSDTSKSHVQINCIDGDCRY
jgi:hypothetical protein